jgi:hypothetical protein
MTRPVLALLVIEAVLLAALLTVTADQVAHAHVETLGGVNIWGYRGPVMHQKKSNELRIAVSGGDLAFGWGVAASEALAPSVRFLVGMSLDVRGRPNRLVTAVTLAARGLPPAGYAAWIDHFAYLRPDVVCLLPDPIDHQPARHEAEFLPDRRSLAFTAFGYSPILPLVIAEKGTMTRSASRRLLATTLARIDAGLGRTVPEPAAAAPDVPAYVAAIEAAVRAAHRAAGRGVVVVLPPNAGPDAAGAAVQAMIASAFRGDPVRVVNLGADPRMAANDLRLDRFSFSTAGHGLAAESVAPAVVELVRRTEPRTP